jgi:hypothetical protein
MARQSRRRNRRRPWWENLGRQELLDIRFRDLDLRVQNTHLAPLVETLHEELADRELRLRPHVWFSHEWFSPDGVPGIAIPFYLAHPRLVRMERRMMLEVEGEGDRECMRLLRHEAGHALCTAFRLHYRKRWREVFGRMSDPYPESYRPKTRSKNYVVHLDWWYAQAHPAEDFAETFAVWLTPNSRWPQRYRNWPALEKLEYVDDLMHRIAGKAPLVRSRRFIDPVSKDSSTLREYYREKQDRYGSGGPEFYDRDLLRLFGRGDEDAIAAPSFLRQNRRRIRESVARWTGEYQYTIDQVLRQMIDRSRELGLRLEYDEEDTLYETTVMVAVQSTRYLHRFPHRIQI